MSGSATILLVEDDRPLLNGIADLLEVADIGYELNVLKATDGAMGLEALRHQIPDLVISDIMMPKMGGFEFLHELRQSPAWVHIPVIFLTARGSKRDVLEGRLSGAELYITKPYDSDELLQLVKSQLDRAHQLQLDRRNRLDVLSQSIVQLLNHEFRTPLTYVSAYSDMLAEGLLSEDIDSLREYLKGIQAGAQRMSRLVDDLIRIMELRTGEFTLRYGQMAGPIKNLSALFEALCRQYAERKYEREVNIECNIQTSLPPVFGERSSLFEACDRLIDNAIKFSLIKRGSAPEVTISAKEQDDEVIFTVKDNGIGFPPHMRSQIFELFFQYNRDALEQQGSGVGLTIVKGLVELHGGRLEADSEEDVGSTFVIGLPLLQVSEHARRRSPGKPAAKKQATVLVVEDEWYLLEGLRDLLAIFESDYELNVLTASDGSEGLQILKKHQPDLIISDIMMPQMDGYEFLSQVRRRPEWVRIPVIFLTAKGDRRDILRGRSSGVEEYITKPYDANELYGLVVAQLDRHFQKQGVMHQDFEDLKRGVLNLLLTDFDMPLSTVTDYTDRLALNIEKAQTDEDLKAYLLGIQTASGQVTQLVEDFILLAELWTGEAVGSFKLKAQPGNASMILQDVGRLFETSDAWTGVSVTADLDIGVLPTLVDAKGLGKSLERLAEVMIALCGSARNVDLKLSSDQRKGAVGLTISSRQAVLESAAVKRMNDLLATYELVLPELAEYDPRLVVASGVIHLHGGRLVIVDDASLGCTFQITLPLYQLFDEPVD